MIAPIKRLQDHLGDLNDAVVTCGVLRDFLTWGTWGRPEVKDVYRHPEMVVVAPGVAAYLAARQEELGKLVITFPEVWPDVVRARVPAACGRPLRGSLGPASQGEDVAVRMAGGPGVKDRGRPRPRWSGGGPGSSRRPSAGPRRPRARAGTPSRA